MSMDELAQKHKQYMQQKEQHIAQIQSLELQLDVLRRGIEQMTQPSRMLTERVVEKLRRICTSDLGQIAITLVASEMGLQQIRSNPPKPPEESDLTA